MKVKEEELQQLVDGRLSASDRQDLLLNIEYHEPERWRDLSLGFVESQMMKEAFAGIEEETPALGMAPGKRALLGSALAACIALGLFLGWQLPERGSEMNTLEKPRQVVDVSQSSELPHYGNLEVEAMDSQPVTIPVLDATDRDFSLQRALEFSANPMQEMQVALSNKGYDSSLETSYVTATLDDGRQLLIPVHRVAIEKEDNQ